MGLTRREKRFYWLLAGIMLVLFLFVVFLFDPYGDQATDEPARNEQADEETTPPPNEYPFTIYFPRLNPAGNASTVVYPLERKSPDADVARYAVEQLLAGPEPQERASGYFTSLELYGDSNCDGQDFTLQQKDAVLILRFCRTVQYENRGSLDLTEAQLKRTLQGLDGVDRVVILTTSGDCVFTDDSCKRTPGSG